MRKEHIKRLITELVELTSNRPCEGIKVEFNEENATEVFAEIDGPTGTPYEGGVFRIKLLLGGEFPTAPPKGYFVTKAFHPNISEKGEICVSVLKKDWKPELGVRHVLLAVRCLLIEPFAESALNEEAGRLLLEDYELFYKQAKLMTSIHATPAKRPMPLSTRHGAGNTQTIDCRSKGLIESGCGSPVMKKAKAAAGPTAAKKRALKRL